MRCIAHRFVIALSDWADKMGCFVENDALTKSYGGWFGCEGASLECFQVDAAFRVAISLIFRLPN